MARQKSKNLNFYLSQLPVGVVLPSLWLNQQGFSRKLIWWYAHSGWLKKLSSKAYYKTGGEISWEGIVYSLQHYLNLPVHIGGKTALTLLGRAHYVTMNDIKTIFLFGGVKVLVPDWIHKSILGKEIFTVIKSDLVTQKDEAAVLKKNFGPYTLKMSTPEQAILEVMHLVPKYETYEEAMLLMESLNNLRPVVVQKILSKCKSVKAKRLFLHAATFYHHPWVDEINLKTIDLGKGKRKIAEGGVYDTKYQLSVPPLKSS